MFYEIVKFEIQYRAKRAETYLYFTILFVCSLVATDFIFQGTGKTIQPDAPYIIAYTMAVASAIFIMIASMIMGVCILRDFDHRMESLLFVNPVTKNAYLLGRFLGSFIVLLFVFSGLLLGMMVSRAMPWHEVNERLPFHFWHYMQPFMYVTLPDLFFAGSLFFVTGALSRKLIVVYTQGIILVVAYLLVSITTNKGQSTDLPGLLDPFAINTINRIVEHWTLTDRNSLALPVDTLLIYNRLLWMGVGVVALVIGYCGFSFNVVLNNSINKKDGHKGSHRHISHQVALPAVTVSLNSRTKLIQLIHHSFFYFISLLKEKPFWAITICGAAIIFVNGINLRTGYGVDSYPATYLIVEELQEMSVPFFLLILVFYSGELVWKERDSRMHLICDALPTSNLLTVSSRFIGIICIYITLLLALFVSGVIMQTVSGYYQYDFQVYFVGFLGEVLPFLVIYTFVAFFFQIMINHRFMAHLATLLFILLTLALEALGYDHDLIRFGGDKLGIYSAMNGYGHFLEPYLWVKSYWLAIGFLMLLAAVLFFVRGPETAWRMRKCQLTKSIICLGALAALTCVVTGSYIFYNTNILNKYVSKNKQENIQANYERTLKRYEYIPQPQIVDVKLKLDLYPNQRDYTVEGQYMLVNKDSIPVAAIHIQQAPDNQVRLQSVKFNRRATKRKEFKQYGYSIYTLNEALQPGDSIKLAFKQTFTTNGFVEGESVTDVVYNGTCLRNTHFPSIGYNRHFELTNSTLRAAFGLPPRLDLAKSDDPRELKNGGSGGDGYEIRFQIIVSTDSSQIAVAPGNLKKEWVTGNRRYFQYQMDQPMINFYSIVSARYKVLYDQWVPTDSTYGRPINLEIYYHKSHTYNLDRMMKSMKASFDYYTRHFGPYAYKQMRIMEYPRYRRYAQSLPGTVPCSEAVGFILDIDDDRDVDMAFYVTAHELAHQWWGMQVIAANVEGRNMILESLAQYSALMVMKATYGENKVEQFLRSQLKEYCKGRSKATRGEKPLALVAGEPYIHYNKGALNLYAFQDFISEEKVNLALRRFVKDWNAFGGSLQQDRYATAEDLLTYFRAVTPDTLQYLIADLFETITIFDNKVVAAQCRKLPENKYKVDLAVQVLKRQVDSLGAEKKLQPGGCIDIGIYTRNKYGKDELIYLKKHEITGQQANLQVVVSRLPGKVVIDPRYIMIDKNRDDNVVQIE